MAVLRELSDRFPDVETVAADDPETWADIVESCMSAAQSEKTVDPNTVEVRIHVRVDVVLDACEYHAAGWGDNGRHDDEARRALEGPTETARYSVITARVPKPDPIAEVDGTVEP